LDPATKSLVSLSDEEKQELVYNVVKAANQPKSSSDADQQNESRHSSGHKYHQQ